MLFKKGFSEKVVNGVRLGNGTVSFQRVKLNVHCFFLDGVLLDTGAQSLEKEFKPFFQDLDIDQVVITHFHEDHTGCARFLQHERQIPLFMNDQMIEYCRNKADYPLYRKLFWGKRKPFQAMAIGKTFQSTNATWDVIESPGHAIDHVAFLNRETGQLFTGDLYCQERTKVVLREEKIPTIIESLKRVLTYDFDEVFCSHAGFLKNGRVALQRKLAYLQELQGKIIDLHDKGLTPIEINTALFPKKYPIMFFSSGEWDSIHIVNSVLKEHTHRSLTL
ncbi:MBL fold metallo-hydrolase [Ferdinandcohnia quinoae]|uniref:MBL fold metallo-hydrolase n=1 Tax=Fredinandcohnia quinoae TaxID=2918902 RepID=A0AAW5E1A8_9BACI|nr:MBL fold metallo-hydrolase [Fredinandcohnia sp. SECRCQ15]MCH1624514.1 MBL fold metallo-hydrolase [Fredinandcohnia sp. SECRCQ15]